MDSINTDQPEVNREHLQGKEAVDKIKEVVARTQTCFFSTTVAGGDSDGTRPMAVQRVDDNGSLWFLSASDSHKNAEVNTNSAVRLYFQSGEHSGFLVLNGRATVSTDRARIRELWTPIAKTWFTEGIDDPRITVIRVTPLDGYYQAWRHGGGCENAHRRRDRPDAG